MRRHWIVLMPLLFLLTGCGDYEEEEVEIGYLGKARANAFLAAERLLDKWGWYVESKHTLNELPEYDDTILIARESIQSTASVDRLLGWVRGGGHLIYISRNGFRRGNDWAEIFHSIKREAEEELMLEKLGVELVESDSGALVTIDFGDERCEVNFDRSAGFRSTNSRSSDITVLDEDGDQMEVPPVVSYRKGSGRITLITDGTPLRNRQIDQHDHALFLTEIGDLAADGASFWFVSGTDVSFVGMLLKYGWMPLLSLVILVILWLWKNLPRFGPRRADTDAVTLKFADHLDMAGHFLWRRRNVEPLLAPMRRRVLRHVARMRGLAHAAPDENESIEWLLQYSEMNPERLRFAMHAKNIKDGAQLTRLIRDLQTLEKTL